MFRKKKKQDASFVSVVKKKTEDEKRRRIGRKKGEKKKNRRKTRGKGKPGGARFNPIKRRTIDPSSGSGVNDEVINFHFFSPRPACRE